MRVTVFRVEDGIRRALIQPGKRAHLAPILVSAADEDLYQQSLTDAIYAVDKAETLPFPPD